MVSPPATTYLLQRLRTLMKASSNGSLNAYIVPSCDAHQSEYLGKADMRRPFISKFTGSAGTAIITEDKAALWTDGRYFLQAAEELDSNWILMKDGLPDTPTFSEWLKDVLVSEAKVGVDPYLMSHNSFKKLSKELHGYSIDLVAVRQNLIDTIWEDKTITEHGFDLRPKRSLNPVKELSIKVAGRAWFEKVEDIREMMKKKQAETLIITSLDEIAWLLNLRGSDIDFNPVFYSYCVMDMSSVCLFMNPESLDKNAAITLQAKDYEVETFEPANPDKPDQHIRILSYDSIAAYIEKHVAPRNKKVWISYRSSEALLGLVPKQNRIMLPSPVEEKKRIKNKVELEGFRNCHIRDGAAVCEYLHWIEIMVEKFPMGHPELYEVQGADYLEGCRKVKERYMGLSFPSISASGSNGAIIHYHPDDEHPRKISRDEMYLIDSGAQYIDGTTDITRTVHFGTPSDKEIETFTLVLKGHIALATAVFPPNIKGSQLDSFARRHLWDAGLDYLHGTGHGVGYFLNVHEGPTSIGIRPSPDDPGMVAGQILSNEPGYYENGQFGIRIENLVITKDVDTKFSNVDKPSKFLSFETITLVPIQQKLINKAMLTSDEIDWLNQYHERCLKLVGDHLDTVDKPDVKKWLQKACEPMTI